MRLIVPVPHAWIPNDPAVAHIEGPALRTRLPSGYSHATLNVTRSSPITWFSMWCAILLPKMPGTRRSSSLSSYVPSLAPCWRADHSGFPAGYCALSPPCWPSSSFMPDSLASEKLAEAAGSSSPFREASRTVRPPGYVNRLAYCQSRGHASPK